jgi:RNA polymerase sigma factor (sigma-70 family)
MSPNDEACRRYREVLVRYIARRLPSSYSAEDVAQEAMLRFITLPRRKAIGSPEAYLRAIAAHLIYDLHVRERRNVVLFNSAIFESSAEQCADESSLDALERLDIEQHLRIVLSNLRPLRAEIVILRHAYGLTLEQIAQHLGISGHTAKKYLTFALAACRKCR